MRTYDIAVIGAGVFGAWTAWHLRRAGATVLLLDAWTPGHNRASSGDESRIIRMGYGADEIYTRMAARSLGWWRQVCPDYFRQTGMLWVAREDDPYSRATRETLRRCEIRAEFLTADALASRYPQMKLEGSGLFGIFEPESGALLARRAVMAVVNDAVRQGVTFESRQVDERSEIPAGILVFACGPWLPKVFPALLGGRIFPTRQEVLFFGTPPGDARYAPPQMPVWIDFTDPRGPYGFPDLEGRGVKLAFDRHGPDFDPDTGDRTVSAESVEESRRFLGERFPGLAGAPLTEARVCQYENTSNGDFLIDRHPERSNVWLVGGGSGHGFKHGPAVGEHVAARIVHNAAPEPRFSLESKQRVQQRTVY